MSFHNSPNVFVREIIRSNLRDLSLVVAPVANLTVDLLAGSGCISEVYCCYVGFEHEGLAPCFRRAVEGGELKVNWMDYASLVGSLRASAEHLPYYPLVGIQGSEIAKVSRVLLETREPRSGRKTLIALPLRPDLSIVHCQSVDEMGAARYHGPLFLDQLLIQASKRSIVIVDQIEKEAATASSLIFQSGIDMISVQPYSAHPHSSWRNYPVDWKHLAEYLSLARTGKIEAYIARYLDGDEQSYLNLVRRKRKAM